MGTTSPGEDAAALVLKEMREEVRGISDSVCSDAAHLERTKLAFAAAGAGVPAYVRETATRGFAAAIEQLRHVELAASGVWRRPSPPIELRLEIAAAIQLATKHLQAWSPGVPAPNPSAPPVAPKPRPAAPEQRVSAFDKRFEQFLANHARLKAKARAEAKAAKAAADRAAEVRRQLEREARAKAEAEFKFQQEVMQMRNDHFGRMTDIVSKGSAALREAYKKGWRPY